MDAWGLDPDGHSADDSTSKSESDYDPLSDDSLDVPGAECLLAPPVALMPGSSASPASAPPSTILAPVSHGIGSMQGKRPKLSFAQRIWVGGVLLLISSLVATAEALLWNYFYTAHQDGMFNIRDALLYPIGPLTAGIVALYTSYLSAVLSDPGRINARGWTPPVSAFPGVVAALANLPAASPSQRDEPISTTATIDEAGTALSPSEGSESQSESDDTDALVVAQRRQLYRLLRAGGARWCTRCQWFQPPRAHHCRQCGVCIARMDHHCPWVGNCVGASNYGDFLRFLFYVDCCLSFNLYLQTKVALDSWHIRRGPPSTLVMSTLLGNMVFSSLVLVMVGGFSLYCFYLAMVNQTSIEASETSRASTLARRGRITSAEGQYPFSLGVVNNLLITLGSRPWLWFVPTLRTHPAPIPTPPAPPSHIPRALNAVLPSTLDQATFASAASCSGWSYPVVTDPLAQYRWPPRDPLRAMERQYRKERLAAEAQSNARAQQRRRSQGQIAPAHATSDSDSGDSQENTSDADSDVPLASLRKGEFALRRRKPAATINPGPAPARAVSQGSQGTWPAEGSSTSSPLPPAGGVAPKSDVGRVKMRRGSEGYEVRTIQYSSQMLPPWTNSDPLAGELPIEARGQPLLPSQVLERRVVATQVQ